MLDVGGVLAFDDIGYPPVQKVGLGFGLGIGLGSGLGGGLGRGGGGQGLG